MQSPIPEIRQAFYRRLLACLPLCGLLETDVAWPNVRFSPEPGRIYLKPHNLLNETICASLSEAGFERLSGIFQISVFGVLNQGEGEIESVARILVDWFRGGTRLGLESCYQGVLISSAWAEPLMLDSGAARPMLPVSAKWTQYTSKGE